MDVIRITMKGYGCDINRGIVPIESEKRIENTLNNVWYKNIFKKIEEKTKIKEVVKENGLINGDIKIEVNGKIIIDTSIKSFEVLVESKKKKVKYPKTEDIVVTSIQHQEGVFSDTIFVLNDKFDLNKLKLIKKDIKDKVGNNITEPLYSEVYYEDEVIPTMDNTTDLRMSRLYFEKN